jgi:hypothetical protein
VRLSLIRFVTGQVVAGLLVGLAARAHAAGGDLNNTEDGAEIVRLIGAAEESYFHVNRHYATFPELLKSGFLEQTAVLSSQHLSAFQKLNPKSEDEPVAGFTLGLTVAPDRASYKLSLFAKSPEGAVGWFTNESQVLRSGKDVESPSAETPAPAIHSAPPRRAWGPPDIDDAVPPVRTDVPCPLPQILEETSRHTQEFVENLQRFSASERIEHIEIGKNGKTQTITSEGGYVAQVKQNSSGYPNVEEFRSGNPGAQQPPLADTATAAFALIFHPLHIGDFDVRCEGLSEMQGAPAWQLHLEESPDPAKSFSAIRIGRSLYLPRFKGRAWIAADSYEVLRIETDLAAPIPEIDLQLEHLTIVYAPVEFQRLHLRMRLPQSTSLYIGYRGHRYQRVHEFSQFQLFSVDADQKIKEPIIQ